MPSFALVLLWLLVFGLIIWLIILTVQGGGPTGATGQPSETGPTGATAVSTGPTGPSGLSLRIAGTGPGGSVIIIDSDGNTASILAATGPTGQTGDVGATGGGLPPVYGEIYLNSNSASQVISDGLVNNFTMFDSIGPFNGTTPTLTPTTSEDQIQIDFDGIYEVHAQFNINVNTSTPQLFAFFLKQDGFPIPSKRWIVQNIEVTDTNAGMAVMTGYLGLTAGEFLSIGYAINNFTSPVTVSGLYAKLTVKRLDIFFPIS